MRLAVHVLIVAGAWLVILVAAWELWLDWWEDGCTPDGRSRHAERRAWQETVLMLARTGALRRVK